jgi:polysaccharide biosynthesis/export protein
MSTERRKKAEAMSGKGIGKACTSVCLLLALSPSASGRQESLAAAERQKTERASLQNPENLPRSSEGPAERYPRYRLRPSDVLQITFPITPEFDQSVAIQPDGYISLRGIGDIHVAGKSLPELTEILNNAYGHFLHDPVINVELKDFEKPYFIAGGQFGRPGKYDLRGDTTVAEAVAIAGGFTDKSKHSEVLLFRRVSGGWEEARRLDMKQMLANRDLAEDIHLQPGDLIYVPQNKLSKVRQFIPSTGLGMTVP